MIDLICFLPTYTTFGIFHYNKDTLGNSLTWLYNYFLVSKIENLDLNFVWWTTVILVYNTQAMRN